MGNETLGAARVLLAHIVILLLADNTFMSLVYFPS